MRLLKRRWLGVPVAVFLALAVVLAGGVAYAYTIAWSGTAEVTVEEAITVSCDGKSDGTWNSETGTWTVSMYPGEIEWIQFKLSNASSVGLTVTPTGTATSSDGQVAGSWDLESYLVPAGSSIYAQFTVTASGSAAVGPYIFNLGFTR